MSASRSRIWLGIYGLAVAAFYLVVAHVNYWPQGSWGNKQGIEVDRPWSTSGDEPHYLLIVNSLLFDHDLHHEADFERVRAGGLEAGMLYRGLRIGGHTFLSNPRTRKSLTCSLECTEADAAKLGAPLNELVQFPAHPAAYPAFMAMLLWPLRPSSVEVEPLVGRLGILVSLAVVLLTYPSARASGLTRPHALAATALVGFASSWLPYVRSYFSEPSIGLFLVLGYLALRKNRPIASGLAVGVAMAMKPAFVVFGAAWIAERLWANDRRCALFLTASVGISGVILIAVNMLTIGVPITAGAIPFALAHGLSSFRDTFLDPKQGLLYFVPWTGIAFVWGPLMSRPTVVDRDGLATVSARRQIVLPMFLCLLVYSLVAWGPGWCYGPRYWVPLMPFFAILVVDFAVSGGPWRRAAVWGLAAVSCLFAVTASVQYHWLFQKPPLASLVGP